MCFAYNVSNITLFIYEVAPMFIVDETSSEKLCKTPVNDISSQRYPATQLLDKADEYVNSFDYELARKFCQRALDAEKENVRALETLGFVELQSSNYEQARCVSFLSCILDACYAQ